MPTRVATINPEIPGDEKLLGENNLVIASTDGYGICMAAAVGHFAIETGAKVEVDCNFPENSPRNFWIGDGRGGPATINSIDPTKYDDVIIFGIVPNNYRGDESVQESVEAYRHLQAKSLNTKVKYAASRQRSRELDPINSISESTDSIEMQLNRFYHEQNERYPVNLVKLARVCAKDREVLEEFEDQSELDYYETLALGVEVASRASIDWHRSSINISPNEQFKAHAEESNRRLQIALQQLHEQNWGFFLGEAQKFRELIDYPVVTLSPEVNGGPSELAFFEIEQIPVGFHFMALEEIARKTKAKTVIASRYNPLSKVRDNEYESSKFKVKVVQNWKNQSNSLDIIKYREFGNTRVTGNQRFTTIEPSNNAEYPEVLRTLILEIDPKLNSVFEGVQNVAIIGNPNRGKSTAAYKLTKYCQMILGNEAKAVRMDKVDATGVTSNRYIEIQLEIADLQHRLSMGEQIDRSIIDTLESQFRKLHEARQAAKIPQWSTDMLENVRHSIDAVEDDQIHIIDFPGGIPIERDSNGMVTKVKKDVPQIEMFLESPKIQGVLVIGSSLEEIAEWTEIVEKVNSIRQQKGYPPVKIIGDAFTSPDEEDFAFADYPTQGEQFKGKIIGLSRRNPMPNSTLFQLGVLISSLGLKKAA